MKKILVLIFFVLMFCTNIYASDDFRVSLESIEKTAEGYCVNYSVFNDSALSVDSSVIVALYDVENKLISHQRAELSLVPNSKALKCASFTTTATVAYVKGFVWDSLDTQRPINNPSILLSSNPATKRVWDFNDTSLRDIGVITEPITVDELTFNYNNKDMSVRSNSIGGLGLYLYGGGTLDNCSVSFNVPENCNIRVYASSTTNDITVPERTLVMADSSGKQLANYSLGGNVVVCDYEYVGAEDKITLFSKASGIYIYRIEFNIQKEANYSNVYVENFMQLKEAVRMVENCGGGNVFVQSDYMECNEVIYLTKQNSNVTIQGAEGYSPVLNYLPLFSVNNIGPASVDNSAFRIRGSNYTIKNLIIEQVPGGAIKILGENAHDNVIDSVVGRYSNGSCVGIFQGAYNNTIQYCDAYRNCDVYTRGGNADGFQAGISAGANNTFINCRAWENSDDGFDNFANYNDVTYIDCVCWNNGNPDIFTGKYDYTRGKALDKNMLFVQLLIQQDSSFEHNYNNSTYKYPTGNFITVVDGESTALISLADFIGDFWDGNPNGFKLGSNVSKHGPQVGPEALRTLKNCIAFNHLGKGIDRNGGIFTLDLTNCISFGNKKNYLTDETTIINFENAITFSGTTADTLVAGTTLIRPNANVQNDYRKRINAVCDEIIEKLNNNEIPGKVDFGMF